MNRQRVVATLAVVVLVLIDAGYWYQKHGLGEAIFFPLNLVGMLLLLIALQKRQKLKELQALQKAVTAAQEHAAESFSASQGPWYGFNGVYRYVVTKNSLWQARGSGRIGSRKPDVRQWPITACQAVVRDDRRLLLSTPDGTVRLTFRSGAEARSAAAALGG